MSLRDRGLGKGIALVCDTQGCPRAFFPRTHRYTASRAAELRERAALFGWSSKVGNGEDFGREPVTSDFCNDCTLDKQRSLSTAAAVGGDQ